MRRRRSASGRFLPAAPKSKARKPARKGSKPRARRNPPRARKNPATMAQARKVAGTAAAALVGGLIAHAAVKIVDRIASASVANVARVLVPAAIGVFATQVKHKDAATAAAGAFGVAGAALAGSIADAIAKPNPTRPEEFYYLDAPAANPPVEPDYLMDSVSQSYRDGVTDLLRA